MSPRGLAEPESAIQRWERARASGPTARWRGLHAGARGLAAVIFVSWSQPTDVVALVIAIVLVAVLGLIDLTGTPPLARGAGHWAEDCDSLHRLPCLRDPLPAWRGGDGHPVWLGAEGRELPQPRPLQGRFGSGNA